MANICYQYEVIISLSASASTTEQRGIFYNFFRFSEVNLLVFEEQMDLGLENPRSDSRSSVHYTYKLSYPVSFASVSFRGVKPNFKNEQKWTKKKIKNQIFFDLFSLSQKRRGLRRSYVARR